MPDSEGTTGAWEWVYDLKNRTAAGTFEALESRLRLVPSEPLILYFEAADPDSPKDENGWCPDCKINSKALFDFVFSPGYQQSPLRLWRVIASWDRTDWKDPAGLPIYSNAFRDPAKPWRLPGLPAALLAVYTPGQEARVIDGVHNPDSLGLEYLRSRGSGNSPLPTERILC